MNFANTFPELEEKKTFSKGYLHLPKITVEKVKKRKSLNSINENSRRSSMYVAKLPSMINSNKGPLNFPKLQFKTTIELMESNEANENLDNFYNKKKKTLNTTLPLFKSSTPMDLIPPDFAQEETNDDYITEYIEVQVLESGCQFGLTEILFESQPNMALVSNGCDCLLLPKDLFIQNATTTYIRYLRREIVPYPKIDEITRSYNEFSSWKKYSSKLITEAHENTKRFKKNKELSASREQLKNQKGNLLLKSSYF